MLFCYKKFGLHLEVREVKISVDSYNNTADIDIATVKPFVKKMFFL